MKTVEFRHSIGRVTAVVAAAIALSACEGVSSPQPVETIPAAIEQCIDMPLPLHIPDARTLGALTLSVDKQQDRLMAEPPVNPARQLIHAQAVVKINVGNVVGTGIVTTDDKNRQIVLSVDHVVALAATPDEITIASPNGGSTAAAGACGFYQINGKVSNPQKMTKGGDEVIDVAILTPMQPLHVAPLVRATSDAPRGSWNDIIGYANDAPLGTPASYGGVALNNDVVLTGVQGYRHKNGEYTSAYNSGPGDSGSGIVDMQDQVRGILYGGALEMYSKDDLNRGFNTQFDSDLGVNTGMTPSRTSITPIEAINELLAATDRYAAPSPDASLATS